MKKLIMLILNMIKNLILCFFLLKINFLFAQEYGIETGLKIPRYVSLKSNDSNLRVGSSVNYPIKLKYVLSNIPIEIIEEYKDWRKIQDFEGNKGWLHKSLIKGERFGIVSPPYKEDVQVYLKPEGETIGKVGKNNIVKIERCLKKWCLIKLKKHKGWINKLNLWGIYNEEIFNIPFYQPLIDFYWNINLNIKWLGR